MRMCFGRRFRFFFFFLSLTYPHVLDTCQTHQLRLIPFLAKSVAVSFAHARLYASYVAGLPVAPFNRVGGVAIKSFGGVWTMGQST